MIKSKMCLMRMIQAGFLTGMMSLIIHVHANNPCIPSATSTADPAPCGPWNDTVYLYCTQDADADLGIKNINCWGTADFVNWKSYGAVLTESDVRWSNNASHVWAPHVVFFNGKYHMYFPETASDGNFYLGHAVAESPHAKFIADAQQMVINGVRSGTAYTTDGVDPFVIMDTAGANDTNWLAWCITEVTPNRNYMGRLSATGDSVLGAPITLSNASFYPDGSHYVEGQWWVKNNVTWYHIYACYYPSSAEQIGCATATSLKGPYTFQGWLMGTNQNSAAGTIHPGCVNHKGKWILFWHCGGEEFGGSLLSAPAMRSTGAEYFQFNTSGAIVSPITPNSAWSIPKTYRGVGIPKCGDTIQVDRVSNTNAASRAITGASITVVDGGEPKGHMVTAIGNNSWLRYDSVDFTNAGQVIVRYASTNESNAVQIRAGTSSSDGTLLATVTLPSTGGLTTWGTSAAANLTATVSDVKSLVLVFTGTANTMKVNWIEFLPGTAIQSSSEAIICQNQNWKRLNKNTFQIALDYGSQAPCIKLFNVTGREITGALTVTATNRYVLITITKKRVSPGSYILSITNGSHNQEIRFIY